MMSSTAPMPADAQIADEPPLFDFHQGDSALVISAPHVGLHLPADIARRMTATGQAMRETDFHVHRLFDFAREFGASTLFATHSRYVIDLNRDPDGASLYPGRFETGLCPLTDFDQNPLYVQYLQPSRDEILHRLEHYWLPYHRQLRKTLDDAVKRHGHALLIDAHSIRGVIPSLFDGRLTDLNFGADSGRTLAPGLLQVLNLWRERCVAYSHVLDGRFRGGYTTRHYGDPDRGIQALQIEIVQDTYLDTAMPDLYDPDIATPLRLTLRPLVEALFTAL